MKLLRLCLKNINCFQKEIELDFEKEPLNEASLFAITGPTGSGKTTLLDALCVALYNKTPRLYGTGNKNTYNLLNQNSDEGFSEVLFEVNGKRYLAEWSVKRTRKGNLKQSAKLIKGDTEELISDRITSRKGNPSVEESVTTILNLDFGAFSRSIMLAQGEFAAFLKAEPEKKREILEATTGMDFYERLKDALNDKTKNVGAKYDGAKTVLENSLMVSDEDIIEVDEQISQLDRDLGQLDLDRKKVADLERKETERTKIHGQFVQTKNRRDELLEQNEDKIDKLEDEIKSARRAADIRPQMEAYEKDQASLNKAGEDLKSAEVSSENAREKHEKAQANFIKASQDYEDARKRSERKMEAINIAEREEVEAKGYLEQAEKRADEIEELNEELEQLNAIIEEDNNELKMINDKIREDESFIKDHPLPEDSERLLKDTSAIVSRLEEMRKIAKDKIANLKKRTRSQKKLQAQLCKLEDNFDELERQANEAEKVYEHTKMALDSLSEKGLEEHWEKQKKVAQSLQDCATSYENAVSKLRENRSLQEDTQKSLEEIGEEYGKVSREFELVAKVVETADEKVKRCEAEEKYALIANESAVLRKEHLKEGEPCPVCGSIGHPWADKKEADAERLITEARNNLSNAKNEREKPNKKLSELDRKKSSLEAKKTELEKDLEQYENKIEKIKSNKTEAESQWRQSYPNRETSFATPKEVSSDYLKEQIAEAEDYLKRINSARNDHQKAENEKRLLAQKLESNQNAIDDNKRQLSEINEEIETVSQEIETANQKLEQTESEFWRMMPSRITNYELRITNRDDRQSAIEIALRKFEERILEVKKRNERLETGRVKRERLKTSIEGNKNRLANERSRLDNLESQEKEYRDKGEELLASAKKKTGGLSAEDARRKLKSELESREAKRDEMQKELQNRRDELKQAETSFDNAKKYYDEVVNRFNETEKLYFNALKGAGFDSPEEHQNSLREPKWIEKNEKTVEDYRKELHSVEKRIAELEATFKEKPYEPDKLNQIQKELKSVEDAIEGKVDKRGKLREKKDKLQEDLKRRRNLEIKLEDVKKEYDRWMKLKECIPANALRDFALDSVFDLLVRFANSKLEELTGRYTLKVKDMKDMVVIDRWNAGEERPVETLSGGETFLTSLSLALALSELSKGRTELNSLFLDEGFGTLDSETLDIALSTLESLRLSGRTIGVISHVRELTRRIPTRIAVKKLGDGSSDLHISS